MKINRAASLVALGLASTPSMASKCRPDKHSSSISSLSVSSASSVPPVSSVSLVSSVSSPSSSPSPTGNSCTSPQLLTNPNFADALFVSNTGWQTIGTNVARVADCGNGQSCAELWADVDFVSAQLFQSFDGTVPYAHYTLKFSYKTVSGMATWAAVYENDGSWLDGFASETALGVAPIGPDRAGTGEGIFETTFTARSSTTSIKVVVSTGNQVQFQVSDFSVNRVCPGPQ